MNRRDFMLTSFSVATCPISTIGETNKIYANDNIASANLISERFEFQNSVVILDSITFKPLKCLETLRVKFKTVKWENGEITELPATIDLEKGRKYKCLDMESGKVVYM